LYCAYSATTGALVTDNDMGACQPNAASTGASGGTGPAAGTVTFQLFDNPNGTGTPLFSDTENLVNDMATSASYTTTATGTDYWVATYNVNFFGVNVNTLASGLADEPVVINSPDTTPPSCALFAVLAGPPKQIIIFVQDTGSGLQTVEVTNSTNAGVGVTPFTAGTTAPVEVNAFKVDPTAASEVALQVTDVARNVTNCDPILTTVSRGTGVAQVFTGVSVADHVVQIANGDPGLRILAVVVNGQRFEVPLRDGDSQSVDVSSAMQAGSANQITLIGQGGPNSSADLTISG
jgi:hypothetical protein